MEQRGEKKEAGGGQGGWTHRGRREARGGPAGRGGAGRLSLAFLRLSEAGGGTNGQKELEAERGRVGGKLGRCDHRMPKQSDRS